jgi:hypothetical protein
LREYDARRYLAEDSFFVQIKSARVSRMEFSEEQVRWLFSLELPFFVASVDRAGSCVSLFCGHRLSDALITRHDRKSLLLVLDSDKTSDELVGPNDNEVHLGPPAMAWSVKDLQEDESLPARFYSVIKSHVDLYKSSLKTRDVGWIEYVTWKTNEPAKRVGFKSAISRPPQESLNRSYDEMMPFFLTWQQELVRTRNWAAARDVVSLLEKAKIVIDRLNFDREELTARQPAQDVNRG